MKVNELFDVRYGHSLELNHLTLSDDADSIAFVSRISKNNGVSARVNQVPGLAPIPAGTLSVALGTRNFTLETNLQVEPYYCGRDVAYLVPKLPMTDVEKLWWAKCIQANRFRFNFSRQANRTLPLLELPDEVPLWVRSMQVPTWSREPLIDTPVLLDTSTWSSFSMGDIFKLHRGRNIHRRDMKPGETPYVSAAARNNGISAWLDAAPAWPADRVTVANNGNGGVGKAFYQPLAFLASSDVTVLEPYRPVPVAASLFICTLIEAERYRWNFNRKWVPSRMKESTIRLPATPDGEPDWNYADRFIKSLPLSSAVL